MAVDSTELVNKALSMIDIKFRSIIILRYIQGFSTKETATDVSGRGVGMDAVKAAITKLRGYIDLHSEKDKGIG